MDVFPTICRLLGVDPPPGATGRAVPAPGWGRAGHPCEAIASLERVAMLRTREWKLLVDFGVGTRELYRPGSPSAERENLAGSHPSVARGLENVLRTRLRELFGSAPR